jgi:transposase
MLESRRRFDQGFKEGAVRLVRETGRPIAQIAKDSGINAGTFGNWVALARRGKDATGRLDEDERLELARLRRENAELAWSVMCSSARSPSGSRTRPVGGSHGRVYRCPEG